jgi:hypothetical protein
MTPHDTVRAFLLQKAEALVQADKAFFEQVLHPNFVYVNTRGVTSVGEFAIGNMTLNDTFVKRTEHRTFVFRSLCVFRVGDTPCQWIAGQTMRPELA